MDILGAHVCSILACVITIALLHSSSPERPPSSEPYGEKSPPD